MILLLKNADNDFPVFLSIVVEQLNVIIDTSLGSSLNEGNISALNYANRLMNFSSGMFVLVISTIMYPIFSDLIVKKEISQLKIEIAKNIIYKRVNSVFLMCS
ncbi:MAG: hypothetical protein IPK06_02280 [Ignavibacteriae bacterium]|nr:hypothetical protein [Ignavibacteriota bacterium]